MRLNFFELQRRTLQWLGDPKGTEFGKPNESLRLMDLVNAAYQNVCNALEAEPLPWSVTGESHRLTVTPYAGVREYELAHIGRLLSVSPVDSAGKIGRNLQIGDYAHRDSRDWNLAKDLYLFRSAADTDHRIYENYTLGGVVGQRRVNFADAPALPAGAVVTGTSTSTVSPGQGEWWLGLVAMPTLFTKLSVEYRPKVTPLTHGAQFPLMLPDEFHECIYFQAALLGKLQAEEDPAGATAAFRASYETALATLNRTHGRTSQVRRIL